MNIKNIEYFLVAAEEMNFTKAAERLYISQQALSTHIRRLEKEYDVRLFERSPALRLTLEGEKMLFYGKQIVAAESNLRAAFSDLSKNRRAHLKVGFSTLRSSVFMPLIWEKYHREWPNISVEVGGGSTDSSEAALQAGKLSLYVGVEVSAKSNEVIRKIAEEKVICCISRSLLEQYRGERMEEFLSRAKGGLELEEIIDMPILTVRRGNRLRRSVDQYFIQRQISPNIVFESNQQGVLYSLSKQGAGAGVFSPEELYAHLHELHRLRGELYVFPLAETMPSTSVYTVYRSDNPLPNYALSFLRDTEEVFHTYTASLSREISAFL